MGQPASLNIITEKTDWVADISAMHAKFGVNSVVTLMEPPSLRAFLEFRVNFLQEELDEIWLAINEGGEKAADDIVDGLIDLCVVAIGTLDAFSVNPHEAWNRVHSKNMQKEVGINPNRPNGFGLPDLVKPAGWTAPSHFDNVGLLSKVFNG